MDNFPEQKPNQKSGQNQNDRRYILLGLKIVGEFGITIAAPIVLLSWIGKRLDIKYGTAPWLLILSFFVAFSISAFRIWKRSKALAKEYESIEKK